MKCRALNIIWVFWGLLVLGACTDNGIRGGATDESTLQAKKELVLDSALIFEFENKARRFADEFLFSRRFKVVKIFDQLAMFLFLADFVVDCNLALNDSVPGEAIVDAFAGSGEKVCDEGGVGG